MYPYRVFLSYSHDDRGTIERLAKVLESAGVAPMWDRHVQPARGFTDQIQNFITNSHIFLPFITAASDTRPWVNQEIGFAIALRKPILPVSMGITPPGIIKSVQALKLQEDLADAPAKLCCEFFRKVMEDQPRLPAMYECTEDNTRRALLLADYAECVSRLDRHAEVRQMASLTTFHLPDRGPAYPGWNVFFRSDPDNRGLFEALQQERAALNKHARACPCRLILDPVERLDEIYRKHGPESVRTRIEGLLSFLRDETFPKVDVAINDYPARNTSITLLGDWFASEAVSSGTSRVLVEARFTRDSWTIRRHIKDFDDQMQEFLARRRWDAGSSRAEAISYLQAHLNRMPAVRT